MQGTISDHQYQSSATALIDSDEIYELVLGAVEWQLMHESTFEKYPLVYSGPGGPVYALKTDGSPRAKALVILFGFEDHGGEKKVVLLDVAFAEKGD